MSDSTAAWSFHYTTKALQFPRTFPSKAKGLQLCQWPQIQISALSPKSSADLQELLGIIRGVTPCMGLEGQRVRA